MASAVFILANKFTDNADAEDANTILRALAIKKYVPSFGRLNSSADRTYRSSVLSRAPRDCALSCAVCSLLVTAGIVSHSPAGRCRLTDAVVRRFVFSQTGRDVSVFVQLIRQGSQPLFMSSVERFLLAHNRSISRLESHQVSRLAFPCAPMSSPTALTTRIRHGAEARTCRRQLHSSARQHGRHQHGGGCRRDEVAAAG